MSNSITQRHVLLMWVLIFTGDEPMLSKAKPNFKGKELTPLVDAGLIRLEKRGKPSYIVLTDRAWQWAEENLDAPFSHSINAASALKGLLPRIKAYLKQTGTPLAELLCAVGASVPAAVSATPSAPQPFAHPLIEEAICTAYLALSGGRWATRVRLAHLRERLVAFPREEQDAALLGMLAERKIVLYPLDDPQETFDSDRAAAVYVGSDPRHLIYMKG